MAVFSTDREGVAVIADSTWSAMQGRKALKVEWDDSGFEHMETADIYKQQGREDLSVVEEEEIEVISQFMPKQLSREEVEALIAALIKDSGASSVKDMGKVMGLANKELAGKADGKLIAEIVKSQLA